MGSGSKPVRSRRRPRRLERVELVEQRLRIRGRLHRLDQALAHVLALLARPVARDLAQDAVQHPVDDLAARDRLAVDRAQRARAQLGERGAQVLDVRLLVAADEAHHVAGGLGRGRDLGVREQANAPVEGAFGEDLDHQHLRHQREHALERLVELRERALGAAPAARVAAHHAHQHVAGDLRLLEREVARGLPHLLVAALVPEARLVARVRLEQALRRGARARCPRSARPPARPARAPSRRG